MVYTKNWTYLHHSDREVPCWTTSIFLLLPSPQMYLLFGQNWKWWPQLTSDTPCCFLLSYYCIAIKLVVNWACKVWESIINIKLYFVNEKKNYLFHSTHNRKSSSTNSSWLEEIYRRQWFSKPLGDSIGMFFECLPCIRHYIMKCSPR